MVNVIFRMANSPRVSKGDSSTLVCIALTRAPCALATDDLRLICYATRFILPCHVTVSDLVGLPLRRAAGVGVESAGNDKRASVKAVHRNELDGCRQPSAKTW